MLAVFGAVALAAEPPPVSPTFLGEPYAGPSNTAGLRFLEKMNQSAVAGTTTLPITGGIGLIYRVMTAGWGIGHPLEDTPCTVSWQGRTVREHLKTPPGEAFFSTKDQAQRFSAVQAFDPSNALPAALGVAMTEMVWGDKWELYAPAELSYGSMEITEMGIEPGEVIIYELEIKQIDGDTHEASEDRVRKEEASGGKTVKPDDQTAADQKAAMDKVNTAAMENENSEPTPYGPAEDPSNTPAPPMSDFEKGEVFKQYLQEKSQKDDKKIDKMKSKMEKQMADFMKKTGVVDKSATDRDIKEYMAKEGSDAFDPANVPEKLQPKAAPAKRKTKKGKGAKKRAADKDEF